MVEARPTLEVCTLGETMAAMNPSSSGPLRHVDTFKKTVGGSESNVAVALARLGHRVGWVGWLGDDEFGKEALSFIRGEGVDTSRVRLKSEARTGLYFKEKGSLGALGVYYYRDGSAASTMRFEELDLDYLLSGRLLHLTGITPLLSESCRDLTLRLASAANDRGVVLSLDANLRWLLLRDRRPWDALEPMLSRADLLFLTDEEATVLFGGGDPETVRLASQSLRARLVVVHRPDGAFVVEEYGVTERTAHEVEAVDTVGAGDAFAAGFLAGWLRGWSTGSCLDLANACGACAVTVPGDAEGMPTEREALALCEGHRRVER